MQAEAREAALQRSPDRGVRYTILTLFFLSGACALVYEVVWMRMLTLVFGATAFATSTILASFFAGLALGSFIFGRVIDRGRWNPLVVYAVLEVGISAFAFLMPVLFAGISDLYVGIARTFDLGFYPISLVRFLLAFTVLLAPATLMGGTLPVIVKFFTTRGEKLGWNVGQLYSLNTLGAVVGSTAAGYLLILMFGVRASAYLAGIVNLAIAAAVYLLYLRFASRADERGEQAAAAGTAGPATTPGPAATPGPETAPAAVPGAAGQEAAGPEPYSDDIARLTLWAFAIAGFCGLALEVFWTRALVFFLDNSTHAFTTILAAFLLGIGLGSLVVARFIDRARRLVGWLGVVQALIGISAILAIPILNNLTPVFEAMADVSIDAMLPWKWMVARLVKSLAVMLVPGLLIGMTFPIVTKIYTRNIERVGTALGNVYSINTVGGVIGSAVAGFVLVPLIGVHHGIILVASLYTATGVVLLLAEPGLRPRVKRPAAAGLAVIFLGLGAYYLAGDAYVLTSYYERMDRPRTLSYEEGIGATVKVYESRLGDRILSVNGFPVAGSALAAEDAQLPLAHLPMLLSPADSPGVHIVGFGAGGTSWGVMQYDTRRVDCVELVPAVPEAAGFFPDINHGVLDEPGFNLILGDGRNYALVTDRSYDVITIDATSPKMAGNGSLYAVEFYELLRERLSDDGIAVQWVPFHLLSEREAKMIIRTFQAVFPETTLWFTPIRQHYILLGTKQPLEIDVERLRRGMARPPVRAAMASLDVRSEVDFLNAFIMGPEQLAEYVGDGHLNTDDRPFLEFTPALAFFISDAFRIRHLVAIRQERESVVPFLTNLGENADSLTARLERRFEATQHSIAGDAHLFLGNRQQAIAEYRQALAIDPTEKNGLSSIWGLDRTSR